MDNISDDSTPTQNDSDNTRIIVTLDPSQYFHYQTHHIPIHAPDGRYLLTIGKAITTEESENLSYRLHEQVALVACLFGSINDTLNMPIPATLGLADLFCRVQEVLNKR